MFENNVRARKYEQRWRRSWSRGIEVPRDFRIESFVRQNYGKELAPDTFTRAPWGAVFPYALCHTSNPLMRGETGIERKERDSDSQTDVQGQPPINHYRREEPPPPPPGAIMGFCVCSRPLLILNTSPTPRPTSVWKRLRCSRVSSIYCPGFECVCVCKGFHSMVKLIT